VGRLIEGGTLRIVQSEADLPEHLNDGQGRIRGVYDPKTDTTWLVADNLTAADAPGVFLHELGVHAGLERMIGAEKYQEIIRQLKAMEGLGNEAVKAARAAIPEGTPEGARDDELVAYLVEKHPELPIVKRIIAAIRAFLFRHGLIKNIRPEDVVALAKAAAKHAARTPSYLPLRKGEGGAGVASAYSGSPLWYSEMAKFIDAKAPGKAPPGQWKILLQGWAKQGRFKGDELEWSGVEEWLGLQQGPVAKDRVLGFIRENGVRVEETTRGEDIPILDDRGRKQVDENGELLVLNEGVEFPYYQLPGGYFYRELLLRLPEKPSHDKGPKGWGDTAGGTRDSVNFRGGHFDQPNILAHVRFNERIDADGERVLFIEEIQSDWAQQGKRKGFEPKTAPLNAGETIPLAPFVQKTEAWVGLALKRMIRYGAENGFDRIAWTTGEQQADRYDLSKQVRQIAVSRIRGGQKDGQYNVSAIGLDGQDVLGGDYPDGKLADVIGKDLADKAVASKDDYNLYVGLDLKVGGEGMKKFYDAIVPNTANAILKKLGGERTKTIDISEDIKLGHQKKYAEHGGLVPTGMQPGFDITPALRASAMRGLPLFSRQEEQQREAIAPAFARRQKMLGYDAWHQQEYGKLPGALTPESHFSAYQAYVAELEKPQPRGKSPAASTGIPEQPLQASAAADRVLKALRDSEGLFSSRFFGRARRLVPEMSKAEFDAAVLELRDRYGENAFLPSDRSMAALDDIERNDWVEDPTRKSRYGWKSVYLGVDLSEIDAVPGSFAAENAGTAPDPDTPDEQGRLQLVRQAMEQIAAGKAEAVARGLRPDLSQYGGDADVHIPWGDSKHGIAHIGSQRGVEVLGRVLRAVALGEQVQYVPAKKTVRITHEGMVAVLSLDEHGKRKTWLLTGWEEGKPDARGEVGTHTAATQPGPTFSRTELGAGFLDSIAAPDGPLYSRAGPPPAPPSQGGEPDTGTPEGSAEALDRIGQAMRATRHGWDAIKSKVLEDWRPAWLGLFTRRQLVDIGQGIVPELADYDRAVQRMDADRSRFDDEAHEVAEIAAAYVRKHRKEADELFDLMHAATLSGTDPAYDFRPSINKQVAFAEIASLRRRMRTRPGDAYLLQAQIDEIWKRLDNEKVRKAAHPGLARRYAALSEEAKAVYAQMRDLYKRRFDEREAALIERIRDAEVDERWKARLIRDIRARFETARLSAPYFPLTRFGDYWVAATNPDGEREYHMRESTAQQKALMETLEGAGYSQIEHGFKIDTLFEQQGASAGFVSNIIKFLDQRMRNSPAASELKDNIYQMYLQSLPEMSARKHWIHRQKTPGFSQDALRGFARQMFHGDRQLALLRQQTAMDKAIASARKTARDASDPVRAAQLVNEIQKRHEWVKNPTTSNWANVAGSLGFLWYLTAPASAIVNATQTPLVAYPLLAARHGWGKSSKELNRAMGDYFKGKFSVEGALRGEDLAAYRRFLADGLIDKTQSHDLAGMSETPSAIYSGRLAQFMRAASFLFHRAERMNREVTALAAFRLARAEGLGFEAAYEQAKGLTWESHFDYVNSNKARFIQGDVPRVLFMFKQFSQHMTYLLARSAHQSIKGLSPGIRADARKRLTGLLGMHALFAGALGMPLMGTLAMVMNALFDDEDEPWDFETEFRNFLAEAFGPEWGQAIARGPVESLTGLGIASRVGLSDLWFREPDRTLKGRGLVEYWTEQLLGPLGGIALKAGTGYELLQEGHIQRGIESMTPSAVRDGLRMLRYGGEGAQSLRGDVVKEDFNPWNLLAQGAGFAPAELAQRYDANRAIKNIETRILDRRERLINRWWLARRTGDQEGVQEAMAAIGRFNQSSAIATNPRARITPATLLASTQARRRYSQRAEGGIIVDQRLGRLPERVRFGG
jgi:hypothetical protein